MNRFILGFLILMTFSSASSQKLFFVYLQSEPEQLFFVKMDEKVHSSTSSGYIILSRLRDSIYSFSIGFPQNKWPEQKFTIAVNAKDHGYLLKNFEEKGWGLFDIQTMTILMAIPDNTPSSGKTEPREVSPFTEILSKAANDPSLKERPVQVKTDEKSVAVQPVVLKEEAMPASESRITKGDQPQVEKKDGSIFVKQEQVSVITKDEPPVKVKVETVILKDDIKNIQAPEYNRSVVTKKSESSTSEGFGLVFIDDYGNGNYDTIRIIIPNPPKGVVEIAEQPKEEKKFLDLSTSDTIIQSEPEIKAIQARIPGQKSFTNTNCSSVATDNDFLKLHKKMAAQKSEDGMVDEAEKVFKSRCFTTAQLKNLSTLFLNDAGKYKFFDTAYSNVADQENFSSLSAELKDEYYINRFKAMLR